MPIATAVGDRHGHQNFGGEFGSIHNFMYQGGTNISECAIFGRIAAKSAFEA